QIGAFWIVDQGANVLRCINLWHEPATVAVEFSKLSLNITFESGVGLPGRIWQSAKVAGITDTFKDDNFPRIMAAKKEGFHGAVGFPVLLGKQVFGVVELFRKQVFELDHALLAELTAIGRQIVQFVKRDLAQQQLHQRIQHLESIYQLNDTITR